jgi:uncharacterized protein YndB with AHSA1/START domain
MGSTFIDIEATIAADLSKVWDYWTKPEHITKWNFADDSWHCPSAENEMKAGGKYIARMEAKDGSFGFDFEATYDEIINHKKISYTIADGRGVTTDFESHGDSTTVKTSFVAEGTNPIEMQKNGWQAILNNFKKYTESN